jgi:hypothetical protein
MLFTKSIPLEYTIIPETVGVVVLVLVRLNTLFLEMVPAACPTYIPARVDPAETMFRTSQLLTVPKVETEAETKIP